MLFDRYGGLLLAFIQSLCCFIPHLVFCINDDPSTYSFAVHSSMALLLGISDSFMNSNSSMTLTKVYCDSSVSEVNASQVLLRINQVSGIVFSCIIGYFFSFRVMSIVMLIFILAANISYYKFVNLHSNEAKKINTKEKETKMISN